MPSFHMAVAFKIQTTVAESAGRCRWLFYSTATRQSLLGGNRFYSTDEQNCVIMLSMSAHLRSESTVQLLLAGVTSFTTQDLLVRA